jgi:hypothetical protein
MVRVFTYVLEVEGLDFTNGVFVINIGKLIEYFPM